MLFRLIPQVARLATLKKSRNYATLKEDNPLAVSGMGGNVGWLLSSAGAPPTKDLTPKFMSIITRIVDARKSADKQTINELPGDAHKYSYVFVRGLFGSFGPFYFTQSINRLKKFGLYTEIAPVDTGNGISHNARIVAEHINSSYANTKKKVVLIGHSKGGIDSLAALLNSTELQDKVHGLITLQTPFGGSPIANFFLGDKRWSSAFETFFVQGLMRGDVSSVRDLTYENQQKFFQQHTITESLKVPVLNFGAYCTSESATYFYPFWKYMKNTLNENNDGMVVLKDQYLPGAYSVTVEGMNHYATVNDSMLLRSRYKGSDVVQALVTLFFEDIDRQNDADG
jgi:pimeloyl-ACP methyl ester carboxylesterase